MSETKNTREGPLWRGVPEEEAVRKLLEEAGPRPLLPEEDLVSIREAAHSAWRSRYGVRASLRRPSRLWMSLAAAALLAVVGLVWWGRTPGPSLPSSPAAASVEVLTGVARWEASGEDSVQLLPNAVGRLLPAGSELETEAGSERMGRLALRMAGGASVRLDAGTQARLVSPTEIELLRGAVYVDTGAKREGHEEVAVRTEAGLFQALGTQFEVRAEPGQGVTRLKVREGSVVLGGRGESVLTDAGGELTVRGDGSLDQHPTPVYGPEWDWVLKTAPMLDIEGMKVRTFLDWISRETGRRVELADKETAALCDSIVLHGSIAHLTPAEAPGVVLSSSGLEHRVSDGTLVVFVAEKEGRQK